MKTINEHFRLQSSQCVPLNRFKHIIPWDNGYHANHLHDEVLKICILYDLPQTICNNKFPLSDFHESHKTNAAENEVKYYTKDILIMALDLFKDGYEIYKFKYSQWVIDKLAA
jgi:hypothetical protein